jgi:polyisoprenoid-binding protein YceI
MEGTMRNLLLSDDKLRAMYRGGRAGATARRFAHLWSAVFGLGLLPKRWVNLEVAGRRTGRVARAAAPVGPVDGTWDAGPGSVAGFRVQESALGMSNAVVGRTDAVSGAVVVSSDRVTRAMFRVGLIAMKVGGKVQPRFADSLGSRVHPIATFTLGQPVALSAAFVSGAAVTVTATGRLAMHGSSRPVTVTIAGRRDGPVLQVAGSIPIAFSGWGIKGPKGFGFLGSLANHGVAEFLLVLHRDGGTG